MDRFLRSKREAHALYLNVTEDVGAGSERMCSAAEGREQEFCCGSASITLRRKNKAFSHRVLATSPEERHPLLFQCVAPLPEEQRLLLVGNCHSKAQKSENLLLGLEETFILFSP